MYELLLVTGVSVAVWLRSLSHNTFYLTYRIRSRGTAWKCAKITVSFCFQDSEEEAVEVTEEVAVVAAEDVVVVRLPHWWALERR